MSLPELPPVLCHAGDSDCYTPDQMTEYGQQCRKVTFNEITRLQALIKKAQSESELIEYRGEPAIVVPYSFMKAATQMPEQAQAVEPVGYVYWAKGHAEGALDNQNLRPGTPLYTHPAPPLASDRASLIRRADASVIALNSRIMEPFYCSLDQDAARVLSDCVDMLKADAKEIEATERQVEILSDDISKCSKQAQQVAVSAEPNLFWNANDAEQCYQGIGEFLNDEICNGSLEVGDFRAIQRAVRLPNIMIRVTSIDEEECDADYEIVESAPQPPQGDTL